MKLLANLRSFLLENHLTYQPRSNLTVGYNAVFNPANSNLDKYDIGFTYEPSAGAFIGLKHDSTSKDHIQFGKFLFYFHHVVSQAQTVGTEFAFDYQKKAVTARLGFAHKFNDDTSAKFKVNQIGYVDLALKHRFSNTLTAGFVTGFSLNNVFIDQKTKTLPIGLSFDLKF